MKNRNKLFLAIIACLALLNVENVFANDTITGSDDYQQFHGQGQLELQQTGLLSAYDIYRFYSQIDQSLGIDFSYPETLLLSIPISQEIPYPEPERIIKRYFLTDGMLTMSIDVWLAENKDFAKWIDEQEIVYEPQLISLIEDDCLDCGTSDVLLYSVPYRFGDYLLIAFKSKSYFFQILINGIQSANDIDQLKRILQSITVFEERMLSDLTIGYIFDAYSHEYNMLLGRSNVPQATNCCNLTSSGNPFPCCDPPGNCTWYVWYRWGGVPFTGDAAFETLTYTDFPREHWRRIRTNNAMERLNREIRRRTKSIGAFPDGLSALMLVCARLRYIEQSEWGQKTYLNIEHLEALLPGDFEMSEKYLTLPLSVISNLRF